MTTIKFIHAAFVEGDASDIEDRLKESLRALRKKKLSTDETVAAAPKSDIFQADDFDDDLTQTVSLSYNDMKKIRRRAATLFQRGMTLSGFAHLKPEEIKRLSVLKAGANLTPPRVETWADEVAAALHAEMPWMAPATETAGTHSAGLRSGDVGLRLPPLLLNGPAGIGKSVWVRRLAEHLEVRQDC